MGKYEESPFAVGSSYPDNVKVEHYKTSWSTHGDFPYATGDYFFYYSTVTIDGEVYIFGELNLNPFPFLKNSVQRITI